VDQYVRLNSTVNDSECIRHYLWTNGDSEPSFTVNFKNSMAVYKGQLKDGLPHGWGTYTHKKRDYNYTGEWRDNHRDGFGTFHWENGDRYIGFVKNGALHGYGYYI
jgi:hypothetical protein